VGHVRLHDAAELPPFAQCGFRLGRGRRGHPGFGVAHGAAVALPSSAAAAAERSATGSVVPERPVSLPAITDTTGLSGPGFCAASQVLPATAAAASPAAIANFQPKARAANLVWLLPGGLRRSRSESGVASLSSSHPATGSHCSRSLRTLAAGNSWMHRPSRAALT
jgi:hypothetical protein